ncbi:hypothetical protein [Streptomyces sp. NPDC060194]|uniref:hypothetical protein n=1 Tax=Streptomyces sp. NPDC060194 TaxID=3347069 RepID=UPI00365B8DEC
MSGDGGRVRGRRGRAVGAVVLMLVAALLTPLAVVAVWASDVVGDTDRYVATMAPLADDPDVQDAVAERVTTAVMERLDLPSLIDGADAADRPLLDDLLGGLSEPVTSGLTGFVRDRVDAFVASPAFASVWDDLNRAAHQAVDNALTGNDEGVVELTDDTVTLDLAPVIERVKQRLVDDGLGVADRIPEIHTDFVLVRSDDIGAARKGFRLLQILGVWLPVAAAVIAAAGVLVAVRRRRALVAAALAVAAGAAVLGLALWVFRAFYLDGLTEGVSQPAAASVYDTLTRFLRDAVRTVVVLGAVVAVGAWLGGAGRWAVRVRSGWAGGIGALRRAVGVGGTGAVGRWVGRARPWADRTVVAVAAAVFVVWDHPTGAVVVGIALCALLALAVIEFLDEGGAPERVRAEVGDL